jgi:Leucine-rich repeat (LRR) protein
VTDEGLVHFRGLKKLRVLSLGSLPITDAAVEQFPPWDDLFYLNLERTRVTGSGLGHLRTLKKLRRLILAETPVTDGGLSHIDELTNLVVLNLKGAARVSDESIPKLLHLPLLSEIDLSETHVSADGYAILKANLPKSVHIIWSEPNDTAARAVLNAGGKVDVAAEGASADIPVQALRDLPTKCFRIRRVSLAGVPHPSNEVFNALTNPGVDALDSLDLSHTAVNDRDLPALKGMTHLRRLVLDDTPIAGPGLIHLKELPELVELRLGCPALSDAFLEELAALKKLERLSLAKSPVSDRSAKRLALLTHLRELDLSDTKITAARIAELKKALPECRIIANSAVL